MENSYRLLIEYSEKVKEFVNKTLENPEVNNGFELVAEGTYGFLNAGSNFLYGILNIVRGTVIVATTPTPQAPLLNYSSKNISVKQNNVTGLWEILEEN